MLKALRKLGRGLLLGLVKLVPARPAAAITGPPASVLVIRTDDRVGNLLLTTPLLAALRKTLPHTEIGLLCAARRAAVVEGTGLYDRLWSFEKRDFFRRPWAFWSQLRALRRRRYAVAIDAGHFHTFSFTSAALAWWSGAPLRIGHRRGEAAHLLNHLVEKDPRVVYDAESKLELLRPLGVEPELGPMRTDLGRRREGEQRSLLGRAVVLNPGARKADHRWPAASFAAAAAEIAKVTGLTPWIAWGPGEEQLAHEVAQRSGARLLPPTDLEQLAAVFRAARLVVTNDTGPMHLAVAVGTPTIAIFLAPDQARWCVPGPRFAAVLAGPNAVTEVALAARAMTVGRLTAPAANP